MKLSTDQLARQLEAQLGGENVSVDPSALAVHAVDGKKPSLLCVPTTKEQLASVLQLCAAAQAALVPWGGGTAMALGNPPHAIDVVVKLHRLDRVIDHDHANLTVTVQSGIALSALQAALAPQKQFVPIDAPLADRSTIGGIVAANLNGPRRMSYGSVRDLVIGMKVVLATGAEIRAGGKVVKNVAGYDMCKLFTGSLGSLGIIAEVTVRVAPIPQDSETVIASGTLKQSIELAGALANSKLLPAAIILRNEIAAQQWRLQVLFEGFATTVARQVNDLHALAHANGMSPESFATAQQQAVWQEIYDFTLQENRLIYRVTAARAALADILKVIESWRAKTANAVIVADVGMGTVWITLAAEKSNIERFAELIALAQRHHGHAVIFAAPGELKSAVDVWGPAPPTLTLMRTLKQEFDPKNLLNPGRFIGGI